ncbi:MAG: tetratricopeptide repeat protein [Nitrososphaeraceae archaeon]
MKKYALTFLLLLTVLFLLTKYSNAQTEELTNDSSSAQNATSLNEFLTRGSELFDAANYEEAITYYDKALSIDPSNLDALFSKGLSLDNLGRLDEAISYYDKVIEIDPTDIDALYNKGLALDNLGRPDEAISYYNKVLNIDPNDVDALYHKGLALDKVGRHSEAIVYYDRVLAINPNDADALNRKKLLVGEGDISKKEGLQPDETLLVIVGVFVLLLIGITIINLVAKRRQVPFLEKSLKQTQPSAENPYKSKDANEIIEDDEWRGI